MKNRRWLYFAFACVIGLLAAGVVSYPSRTEKVAYKSNKEELGPIKHEQDGVVFKQDFYTTTEILFLKDESFKIGECYEQFSQVTINETSVFIYRSDILVFVGIPIGVTSDGTGLICQHVSRPVEVLILYKLKMPDGEFALFVQDPTIASSYLLGPTTECPELKN
jgi:hypothetical protein